MRKIILWVLPCLLFAATALAQPKPGGSASGSTAQVTGKQTDKVTVNDAFVPLAPTIKQERVDELITEIFTKYHYRKLPLNDSLSSAVFDRFLKTLDFNRVYLLDSDVQKFEKFRYVLDDALRAGDLMPPYDMFNVFKKHFKERSDYANSLLDKEFDFTADETYVTDREKSPWCKTAADLDNEWRKLIKNQALSLKITGKTWPETVKMLRDRYKVQEKGIVQYTSEDVFQLYMNAFAEAIDPHSSYFSPAAAANFKIDMSNSLEGIGASLRTENDYTKVADIIAGGPAFKSKLLLKDDRIVGVAQGDTGKMADVVGLRIDEVVKLIRGKKGTTVRLSVLAAAEGDNAIPREIRLVREKVKLQDAAAKKEVVPLTYNGKDYKFGVIDLPSFYMDFEAAQRGEKDYSSTTRDVRKLLKDLTDEGVNGVVLDLRNNGGGSLTEAINLTGLFIPNGPVVQVRDMEGKVDVQRDNDPAAVYSGPLMVLTNRFSASASEIFAGAIQDYQRGVVVGEQTYGKGTVQNLIDLNRFMPDEPDRLGQLKITTAKFYRITGSSTQHRGVTPDVPFPSAYSAEEFGESSEASAMPWDQIASSRFVPTRNVTSRALSHLVSKSAQRFKTEPSLKNYAEEVKESKEAREKKTVSLQETKRRQERDEADKRRAARNKLTGVKIESPETPGKTPVKDTKAPKPKDIVMEEATRVFADWLASLG